MKRREGGKERESLLRRQGRERQAGVCVCVCVCGGESVCGWGEATREEKIWPTRKHRRNRRNGESAPVQKVTDTIASYYMGDV